MSHSVESEMKQIYDYINGKLSDILQKSMGFYVLRKKIRIMVYPYCQTNQ